MPVCVTEVTLQHLALATRRPSTLSAEDDLVVTICGFQVVRLLITIAAVLGSGQRQHYKPSEDASREELTRETS
jgi:hypothetical protein